MKIQVGKTYKDGEDNDVYIEAIHTRTKDALNGYPYYGSVSSGRWCTFNEDGKAHIFGRTFLSEPSKFDLLPNKVTVTKYSFTYSANGQTRYNSNNLHDTKEARDIALSRVDITYRPVASTVTYEIEE
jgi:hypothetical protein